MTLWGEEEGEVADRGEKAPSWEREGVGEGAVILVGVAVLDSAVSIYNEK